MWKGTLSFGLVNIPVRLVSTTRSSRVSFRQLHGEDRGPIKQERKCTVCGEVVPSKELVKGVEVGEGAFVVVTDEELERAEPQSSTALAIREFVPARDIDPLYVERSYALAPQAGGERAYALLHDALTRRDEAAVGQLTMRNREHLVAIRPGPQRVLFADVLHYAEEVRDLTEIEAQVRREEDVTEEEAELADLLIARMSKPWDPAKYEDHYAEAVRGLVAAKAKGEVYQAPRKGSRPTTDLLAALRETLAQQGGGEAAEAREA